jgi:GNAT superfamily N-acetyltransferase
VDPTELARREHENMIGALALLGSKADGALVRRADGVAVISTGLPFLLFNQVIVDGGEATPAALSTGVAVMRERGGRFVVNLRVGSDDRFIALMAELGLAPLSERPWMPGMALHPMPEDGAPADPPGHEIRGVNDRAGLEDHIRTASAGFELPEGLLRAVMVMDLIGREGAAIYVGYTDGEPVTTGLGYRSGRTIGVYNVATLAAARGQGYGAAMTRRVAADGVAAGCDVAILQASEMGHPVYERLGYRTVVEYMGYIEAPTPE